MARKKNLQLTFANTFWKNFLETIFVARKNLHETAVRPAAHSNLFCLHWSGAHAESRRWSVHGRRGIWHCTSCAAAINPCISGPMLVAVGYSESAVGYSESESLSNTPARTQWRPFLEKHSWVWQQSRSPQSHCHPLHVRCEVYPLISVTLTVADSPPALSAAVAFAGRA